MLVDRLAYAKTYLTKIRAPAPNRVRLLYIKYPKFQSLSGKLSWSHYTELLNISDDLFERLAFSKDKEGVLKLLIEKESEKGEA